MAALESRYGRPALVRALRAEAAALRGRESDGATGDAVISTIEAAVGARLAREATPSLRRVVNATGVILHTNLGRAPLGADAAARVAALAAGYTNLEYDLEAGIRGRRDVHAERDLCRLTGAEAAVVVNNNAAATLILLTAIASGREVIISRGELVEIGGGFRVPDVLAQSGAILREVGTTNRTRAADYAAAINDRTALILRVHPSNFQMMGFTERPAVADLVDIGGRFGIPVAEDIGSGYLGLSDRAASLLPEEPVVSASISAGADAVMFSGDKLLGGPQAGIIVGTESVVSRVRTHPLMRAVRVDKLTYAALEATLEEVSAGRAHLTVPVARMLALTVEEIDRRATALASALSSRGLAAIVVDGESTVGGGSAPGAVLPTRLVAVTHAGLSATGLESHLRSQPVPVIARIESGRVVVDLRTVDPADDAAVAEAFVSIGPSA
jgi:L-seryl-tRNA(Ser) seleniumtransferase